MLWQDPTKPVVSQDKARSYSIRPGSSLDAPKALSLRPRDFEDALQEHFMKQGDRDVQLMLAMAPIYDIYRKEGVVNVVSPQNRVLKARHEYVVVQLLKENLQHLKHLETYLPKTA